LERVIYTLGLLHLNSFEFLSSSETFSDFLYTRSITGTTDIFGTTKRTFGT
jgi:hypothetical protein